MTCFASFLSNRPLSPNRDVRTRLGRVNPPIVDSGARNLISSNVGKKEPSEKTDFRRIFFFNRFSFLTQAKFFPLLTVVCPIESLTFNPRTKTLRKKEKERTSPVVDYVSGIGQVLSQSLLVTIVS